MPLPTMTGPDFFKKLEKVPATAAIAVVVFTGFSQKNAARLRQDGAFRTSRSLGLDQGCDGLLASMEGVARKLKLEVPVGAERYVGAREFRVVSEGAPLRAVTFVSAVIGFSDPIPGHSFPIGYRFPRSSDGSSS